MKSQSIKRAKGFTLVEVMIVVAIMGILAAIGIPQYKQYVVRANRAAAQAFMMDVASREKQYLLDARSYAPTLAALSMTAPTDVARNYNITICLDSTGGACATPSSPPYFLVSAAPIAGKAQAADGTQTLDSAGVKTGTW